MSRDVADGHEGPGHGLIRLLMLQSPTGAAAMDRQAILDRLRAEAPALREKYRIESLAVFGSMARGDDWEGSDIDILVKFQGRADFDRFMGLKLDLEDLFQRPVDLGTPDMIRPAMRARIEKDLLHVT
jgi:predicted nucleotidyltransferase